MQYGVEELEHMMLRKAKQFISEWDNVTREGRLRSAMNCAVGARLDSKYGQKTPNSLLKKS